MVEAGDVESVEDQRKRRLTLIFGIVGTTLFLLAVLMVAIGLKMSSHPMSPINRTCKSTYFDDDIVSRDI